MTIPLAGLPVFVEVFWKSSVALGAALCINWLLRKKSADARRLVLSTAVVVLLAAAAALPVLPRWTAVTPAWLEFGSRTAPVAFVAPSEPAGGNESLGPIARAVQEEPASGVVRNWVPGAVPLIWFVGTMLLLVRFVISLCGLRRLRKASVALNDADLRACLNAAHGRGVALLQNEAIAAPVTWGIFRPIILVPSGFEQLPAESREAVLCHELAHVHGYDFLLRGLSEVVRALIWFQPLMWIVRRQLREEQELVCDNRVLAAGGRSSAYAKMLLDWNVRPGMDALAAVGMTHRGCLKRRLYALLDQDLRRDRVARAGVVATWMVGLAAALPLAALSFTHAAPVPLAVPLLPAGPTAQVLTAPVAQMPAAPSSAVLMAQARRAPIPVPAPATAPTATIVRSALRFVARTNLVLENVTAVDKDGRNIAGLRCGDFAVTEDGAAQTLSLCEFQKLDEILAGSYYVLGFYSTNVKADGSYRKVGIALQRDPTAKLNYRAGYYASKVDFPSLFTVDGVTDTDTGSSLTAPSLLSQISPEYSEEARKAKYSGNVLLGIRIDAAGNVADVSVVRSLGMGLDEKAAQAVRKWQFQPGVKDGKPVAVDAQVEVNFRLL